MKIEPSPATAATKRHELLICLLLIFLAACAAYGNTLCFDYIWEDRNTYLESNPAQHLHNVPRFFITSAADGFSVSHTTPYYRPLFLLQLSLEYTLLGPKPLLNHAVNLIIHFANAATIFLLARRLNAAAGAGALVAGLLFAVHPAITEGVSYLLGRGDLLCALFMANSVLAWLRYRQDGRTVWLAAAMTLQSMALLTKEMAITLPVIFLLLELSRRNSRRLALILLPLAVSGAYLVVRFSVLAQQAWTSTPLTERLYTAITVTGRYLLMLVAPLKVQTLYDVPVMFSLRQTEVLAMMAVVVIYLAVALLAWRRQQRQLALLLLVMPVLLFPVSNLPGMLLPSPMASRYLYIPAMAFCLAAGLASTLLTGPLSPAQLLSRRLPAAGLALLCLLLAGLNMANNRKWRNNDTFFTAMLQEAPNLPLAYKLAGNYYGKTGRGMEMARLNMQALEVTKLRQLALAGELLKYGQYDRAAFELQRIIGADSDPRILQTLARIQAARQGVRQ